MIKLLFEMLITALTRLFVRFSRETFNVSRERLHGEGGSMRARPGPDTEVYQTSDCTRNYTKHSPI